MQRTDVEKLAGRFQIGNELNIVSAGASVSDNLDDNSLARDLRLYGDNLQIGRRQPFQIVEQLGPRECASSNLLIDML